MNLQTFYLFVMEIIAVKKSLKITFLLFADSDNDNIKLLCNISD